MFSSFDERFWLLHGSKISLVPNGTLYHLERVAGTSFLKREGTFSSCDWSVVAYEKQEPIKGPCNKRPVIIYRLGWDGGFFLGHWSI